MEFLPQIIRISIVSERHDLTETKGENFKSSSSSARVKIKVGLPYEGDQLLFSLNWSHIGGDISSELYGD